MIVETIDSINVTEDKSVCVQFKTSVLKDGKLISTTFHNHAINPGDKYDSEDVRVQAICAATHTAEVIEAYKAAIAAQGV